MNEKVKKTLPEVDFFATMKEQFCKTHAETAGKFKYALERVSKKMQSQIEDLQDALNEADIRHVSVDKEGNIAKDERGMEMFTPEKMIERNKARRKIQRETMIEVEPYFATEVPEDLTDTQKDAFVGFVIKESSNGTEIPS